MNSSRSVSRSGLPRADLPSHRRERRRDAEYAALIVVNVLPPLIFGGVLSMGRLTSVLFPTFLWLGAVIPANHRSSWLVGFAMLQALFAIAFFTWRPLY